MFEEMRWLEYSQRLQRHRRGVYPSLARYEGMNELAPMLMNCATIYGASHLGVDTGKIETGKWADFAALDLRAAVLRDVHDRHLLGAMILGGSAEGLVTDTCMAGKWTRRVFA